MRLCPPSFEARPLNSTGEAFKLGLSQPVVDRKLWLLGDIGRADTVAESGRQEQVVGKPDDVNPVNGGETRDESTGKPRSRNGDAASDAPIADRVQGWVFPAVMLAVSLEVVEFGMVRLSMKVRSSSNCSWISFA